MAKRATSRRIIEFDLLRGFFIMVITLDHLAYWPSPLAFFSGKGWLWVSSAEGFFLISGFLIGFIRAYKGRHKDLWQVTKSLWRRALKLYLWGVGITLFLMAITALVPPDNVNTLPSLPPEDTTVGSTVVNVLLMRTFHAWIFFLRMYAVMLLVTPVFLWLVRKGKLWVAVLASVLVYASSLFFETPEAVVQWQLLFFLAAALGYVFTPVRKWMAEHVTWRNVMIVGLVSVTAVTMVLSGIAIHGEHLMNQLGLGDFQTNLHHWGNSTFSNFPMQPGRMILAFIWFGGLLAFFHVLRDPIMKFLGWVLVPFGKYSLTAYCLQAIILPFIVIITEAHGSLWNMFVGLLTIMIMWLLMKSKLVLKIMPQ